MKKPHTSLQLSALLSTHTQLGAAVAILVSTAKFIQCEYQYPKPRGDPTARETSFPCYMDEESSCRVGKIAPLFLLVLPWCPFYHWTQSSGQEMPVYWEAPPFPSLSCPQAADQSNARVPIPFRHEREASQLVPLPACSSVLIQNASNLKLAF